MKIILLTHEREVKRITNTGFLALDGSNNIVERVVWNRVNPNKYLVNLIKNDEAILLYSKSDISTTNIVTTQPTFKKPAFIEHYENIIIIDSTWQEARKIFNHSDYLKSAPRCTLNTGSRSLYNLRANQPHGGLCTIECIIEVLKLKNEHKIAADLLIKFQLFNG